jgi:hypothetical protein
MDIERMTKLAAEIADLQRQYIEEKRRQDEARKVFLGISDKLIIAQSEYQKLCDAALIEGGGMARDEFNKLAFA